MIKDCYKVILCKLELLKAQLEKQSFKTRGSLDLNETSKEPLLTQYLTDLVKSLYECIKKNLFRRCQYLGWSMVLSIHII